MYIFASANEGGNINNAFENKENHALSQSPYDATEDVAHALTIMLCP